MRRCGFCVEVVVTGDEIMLGRILDTNSGWISGRCVELGARVRRVTCVGDEADEIGAALTEALERGNDLVIFTGGLGPSEDDITIEAIGRAVSRRVVLDEEAVEEIRRIYAERGVHDTVRGERMARILEGSRAIPNPVGMSVGMMLIVGVTAVVTLPGVPAEMMAMFDGYVAPFIEERSGSRFVARTVTARVVFKDFFPVYRQMQRDYPEAYLKNAATPPESPEGRLMVKDIKVDVVVGGSTRGEGEERMDRLLEDFRERIEAVGGVLLAD